MAGPFDYTIQAPDIGGQVMRGFEQGFALNQFQRQRMAEEQAAQQAAAQQAEAQRIQQEFYSTPNPTAMDVIRFANTLPSAQVTALKDQFSALPKEAQQRDLQMGGQVLSALTAGDGKAAASILDQRAEAFRNSGDTQTAQFWDTLARVSEADTDLAARSIMPLIAVLPDGEKVVTSVLAQRKAPAEEAEGRAKASKAATEAKFAESGALLDLEKKGWDIKKVRADIDIAREDNRIKAMNAAIAREGNDLKRQELQLKIQDAISARDEKVRAKVADVESANANIDNMLNTVDRVLKNPSLDDVLGSLEGRMPSAASVLDDEESDAIALIETLGSQAFLAQIPNIKGMGALSNAEGEKLQSALQNLGRAQSESQFRASAKEAQRLMMKARKNVADRYGAPNSVPDTPAVQPSASEIDDLVNKYAR